MQTDILRVPPQAVHRGDRILSINGQDLPSPMVAVGDFERAADGVPRVPVQAPTRTDVEWNWYPETSGATEVTIQRPKPRRFRTAEGAAKALAQDAGVRGFAGGYLGFPADMPPSDVRAAAARLQAAVTAVHRGTALHYWRLNPSRSAPFHGWTDLCHHIARTRLIQIDTATMKGWKWRDTL